MADNDKRGPEQSVKLCQWETTTTLRPPRWLLTANVEPSQLRQDVLDVKVQMKNQLNNTLMLLSNESQPLSPPLLLNKIPPAPILPPLPLVPTVLAKE